MALSRSESSVLVVSGASGLTGGRRAAQMVPLIGGQMERGSTPGEKEIAALHADFDKYRKLAMERLDAGHLKIADQLLSLIGDIAKRAGNLEGIALDQASEVPDDAPSPTPPKDYPSIWRDRAEEARAQAEQMKHQETRRQMLAIAARYEKLADEAEPRATKKTKS